MEITWGWDLVLILAILALVVCVLAFDMLENWKSKRRSDMNALLLTVSIYSLLVLLVSEVGTPTKIVLGSAFVVLATMGYVATTYEFGEDSGPKPWELWFVSFFMLTVLVVSILWFYFYTDTGKGVQRATSKLSSRLEQYKMKRRNRVKTRSNAIEMTQL